MSNGYKYNSEMAESLRMLDACKKSIRFEVYIEFVDAMVDYNSKGLSPISIMKRLVEEWELKV